MQDFLEPTDYCYIGPPNEKVNHNGTTELEKPHHVDRG